MVFEMVMSGKSLARFALSLAYVATARDRKMPAVNRGRATSLSWVKAAASQSLFDNLLSVVDR
jgi:hypothetical protein